MMTRRTGNQIRYGSNTKLPQRRVLRAGPLTAELENADLRYVRVGDVEIVRRLYFAVRDRNWGTVEPVYTKFELDDRGDSFRVDIEAEHVDAESGVDFAWSGVIEGTHEGTIRYEMEGSPRSAFLRNRIGFCVLHPSELAGAPAWTDTPDGRVESFFPELISPHQPFIDMESITHAAGEHTTAEIRFEGDLFEMEDQRNWTDASYKTYSTPLRIPYPVEVTPGQEIRQAVTIEVFGEGSSIGSGVGAESNALTVDLSRSARLPAIGFGAGGKQPIGEMEMARLTALRPAFVQTEIDLGAEDWREKLTRAAERATALGAALNLSVVGRREPDDPSEGAPSGWEELAAAAKGLPLALVFVFPPVHEHVTFPRDDLATHPETIKAAKAAFRAAGSTAGIGGGTRAFFTELNRAVDFLPVGDLEVVTFTINPQVHAFDNLSIMECISAQTDVVRSARAMIGERPLVVGPITLRQQWNPNATSAPPDPGPDTLPSSVDPRQLSLFAAAWTVGSLKRMADEGVDAVTYFELQGWKGLIEGREHLTRRELFPSDPGQLFPVYHVFRALAPFVGGESVWVETPKPFEAAALAMTKDGNVRVLVANLTEFDQEIALEGLGVSSAMVTVLDETAYEAASADPEFVTSSLVPLTVVEGRSTLVLKPYAVAFMDGANGVA
ncbi:MAG: hypothetical protein E6R14_04540 [Thermomicrobiales bacterium]|nr:MAG: hypothetical protein E6R14_04540 [Thermomicrobiales bacterium]